MPRIKIASSNASDYSLQHLSFRNSSHVFWQKHRAFVPVCACFRARARTCVQTNVLNNFYWTLQIYKCFDPDLAVFVAASPTIVVRWIFRVKPTFKSNKSKRCTTLLSTFPHFCDCVYAYFQLSACSVCIQPGHCKQKDLFSFTEYSLIQFRSVINIMLSEVWWEILRYWWTCGEIYENANRKIFDSTKAQTLHHESATFIYGFQHMSMLYILCSQVYNKLAFS